jgi:hypothetical protein
VDKPPAATAATTCAAVDERSQSETNGEPVSCIETLPALCWQCALIVSDSSYASAAAASSSAAAVNLLCKLCYSLHNARFNE